MRNILAIIYLRKQKKKVDKTVTYAKNAENKGVDKQEYIPNKRGIDVTEAMISSGLDVLYNFYQQGWNERETVVKLLNIPSQQ